MAERLPAVVRLAAEAMGVDTKTLGKMMEKGELKPSEFLPKLFSKLGEKADQGWSERLKTVGHQQGQAQNAFAELIRTFTFAGGDQGFTNIWKFFAESLRELTPLVRVIGESFYDWSKQLDKITNTLRLASDGMERVDRILEKNKGTWEKLKPWVSAVAEGFLIFTSRLYRLYTAFKFVIVLVEDFLAFLEGKGSVIGEINKALKDGNWQLAGTELVNLIKALELESIAAAAGIWGLWKALKKITGLGGNKGESTVSTTDTSKGGRKRPTPSTSKTYNERMNGGKLKSIADKAKVFAPWLLRRASVPATTVYGIHEFVNDVDENSTQFLHIPAGVGGIGMINTYRQAMIGIKQGQAVRAKEAASWDYLSPNVQDFIKSMTTFQGAPALSERLNDMTNFRGVTNQQGQIVIQNLNMNVSGNNAPPELLARKIVDETASRVLQLTPNSY